MMIEQTLGKEMGFIFQKFHLLDVMNTIENVEFLCCYLVLIQMRHLFGKKSLEK